MLLAIRTPVAFLSVSLFTFGAACGNESTAGSLEPGSLDCSIPAHQIFDGGPGKDGIPALDNPQLVGVGDAGIEYLRADDRVIGLEWNGEAIAVPHNIGWWHEIVNFDLQALHVAVTFCPLTGSSLAFDRTAADEATFGVSGLLYQNNLIMYDRNNPESLWPQMARGARCGPRNGASLRMIPVIEMTWEGWRSLHPDTRVVSGDNGSGRDYRQYPYGSYDQIENGELLFPVQSVDRRRPLKERVLGVPSSNGDGGVAFPFGELASAGSIATVRYDEGDGGPFVVFWDESVAAAMAYRPIVAGQAMTFEVRDNVIVDIETGSVWDVEGRARSGVLSGVRLEPVAEAYVAFWFAWAAFHRQTILWAETAT